MTPEQYKTLKPTLDRIVRSDLINLADREACIATERYGLYHSPHEGLAIIQEEAAEAKRALHDAEFQLSAFRSCIYGDSTPSEMEQHAQQAYIRAIDVAHEAIHVLATLQRFRQSLKEKHGEFAELPDVRNSYRGYTATKTLKPDLHAALRYYNASYRCAKAQQYADDERTSTDS